MSDAAAACSGQRCPQLAGSLQSQQAASAQIASAENPAQDLDGEMLCSDFSHLLHIFFIFLKPFSLKMVNTLLTRRETQLIRPFLKQ